MTVDLVADCLWLDLEPARKLVLLCLCENANKEGLAWPGRDLIAYRASLSERRVSPHLTALERAGYMATVKRHRGGPMPGTTLRRMNVSRIHAEAEERRRTFEVMREQSRDESSHVSEKPVKQGTDRPVKGDVSEIKGDVASDQRGRRDAGNRKEPSLITSMNRNGDAPEFSKDEERVLTWLANTGELPPASTPKKAAEYKRIAQRLTAV